MSASGNKESKHEEEEEEEEQECFAWRRISPLHVSWSASCSLSRWELELHGDKEGRCYVWWGCYRLPHCTNSAWASRELISHTTRRRLSIVCRRLGIQNTSLLDRPLSPSEWVWRPHVQLCLHRRHCIVYRRRNYISASGRIAHNITTEKKNKTRKPWSRRETVRCCCEFRSIQSVQAVVRFVWYFSCEFIWPQW